MNLSDVLAMALGAGLSAALELIPGLREKWGTLDSRTKQLIMWGALLIVTAIAMTISCTGWGETVQEATGVSTPACTKSGFLEAVQAFFLAVGVNQGVYGLVKRKAAAG